MSTFETVGATQFLVFQGQQELASALGAALKAAFRRIVQSLSSRAPVGLP